MKFAIFTQNIESMLSIRAPLLQRWLQAGHDVHIICNTPSASLPDSALLKKITLHHFPYTRNLHFIQNVKYILTLKRLNKAIQPDYWISFGLKQNVLSLFLKQKKIINVITGLGSGFLKPYYRMIISTLIKLKNHTSTNLPYWIFLNQDDKRYFESKKLALSTHTDLLPGEGIDVDTFKYTPLTSPSPFTFLYAGRLIKDKGIQEFLEASKKIVQEKNVKINIIGTLDLDNPSCISEKTLLTMLSPAIEYIPWTNDIQRYLIEAHCIVLPSYGEGLPLILLEAMAVGRPIITSKVNGCRELISDNGYLCHPKDSDDLYLKMRTMLNLPLTSLQSMGEQSRKQVAKHYTTQHVISKFDEILKEFSIG